MPYESPSASAGAPGWRSRWWNLFKLPPPIVARPGRPESLPVLLIVEGPHDMQFLRRISRVLHRQNDRLPELPQLEEMGQIVFLPLGGNGPWVWADRLASLGKLEFHLYDREMPPESLRRQQAIAPLNRRPGRRAVLTAKRSLENYLSPAAIQEACGVEVSVGDNDPVADLVARAIYAARRHDDPWPLLSPRAQKRLRERAKRLLNRDAVDRMTAPRLAERDPAGEIASWLEMIAELIEGRY